MADTNYNLEQVNFLILEDNVHMRTLIRSILNALGARSIREAGDVETAFQMLRTSPSDMVICDWEMEPVSGLDFVKQVRNDKNSPNPQIPIIMLTAHSEMTRVMEARDSGINEFVIKPISAKTLYARIRDIIKHPRNYVQTETYFGPDRRRRQAQISGPDRRKGAPTAELTMEERRALLGD